MQLPYIPPGESVTLDSGVVLTSNYGVIDPEKADGHYNRGTTITWRDKGLTFQAIQQSHMIHLQVGSDRILLHYGYTSPSETTKRKLEEAPGLRKYVQDIFAQAVAKRAEEAENRRKLEAAAVEAEQQARATRLAALDALLAGE